MEKFIPYEKLSKKKQREQNRKARATWGNVNPVTRKTKNPKAYERQKTRLQREDFDGVSFVFYMQKVRMKNASDGIYFLDGREKLWYYN